MEETEVQEVAVEEVEEKKEASPSKETTQQAKYTDEDVNAIVDKKFAKWQKDLEAKKQEAEKLAKMNAEQKALHEKNN
ncbi:DUF4355 domain-containing protein [Vagococcus sp. CY52-2]|uniref:capsid assembly scaffolding protein Gp46 family protein n=1 Tax=Vagococcus sp. CY52-2 TaxID=2925838 RepID=UPI0021116A07|nr:DUF4355 domain-containing protein [Vagococcus sp. CY52-2]